MNRAARLSLNLSHWAVLVLTAGLVLAVGLFVNLEPKVDQSFFFASDNPAFEQAKRIGKIFPDDSIVVAAATTDNIHSESYQRGIARLTRELEKLPQVLDVKSIASGPDDLEHALESPLWRRMLILKETSGTNIIMLVERVNPKQLIANIEQVTAKAQGPDLDIRLAGIPYVVEQIRRNLVRDFKYFSVTAIVMFSLVLLLIFRSWRILLGSMVCCIAAIMLTLIAQQLIGQRIGLLTTNLATIVFVLTQSHIVFMTSNWRNLARDEGADGLTLKAWRMTFTASFWCMVTTLLGFASLILVDAAPLRQLGISGSIGTVAAMLSAYLLYPAYLRWTPPPRARAKSKQEKAGGLWSRPFLIPTSALIAISIMLATGLTKLNLDPSLFEYFNKGSTLHQSLVFIDKNGGSSPLKLVVSDAQGGKLNTSEAYERMWALQRTLETDPAVGSVISLPLLMAEANSAPFAFLLSWEWLLQIMEKPKYDRVADSFITDDRRQAKFVLRMSEGRSEAHRLEVVERLKRLTRQQGFQVDMVGGIYFLQGKLSRYVSSSLVQGLGGLLAGFAVIAVIVSRSLRVTLAMLFCLALIPVSIIGGVGVFRVPMDIISAPASNVCIGLAVDMMIHLALAMRRVRDECESQWQAWVQARKGQWRGILSSAGVVASGFAIFALSNFPPTQRFGLAVAFGTLIAAGIALWVLPLLAGGGHATAKD